MIGVAKAKGRETVICKLPFNPEMCPSKGGRGFLRGGSAFCFLLHTTTGEGKERWGEWGPERGNAHSDHAGQGWTAGAD